MKSFNKSLRLSILGFLFLASGTAGFAQPTITSLSLPTAPIGAIVTINGLNFGATQGTSAVTFNGHTAAITLWSQTTIGAVVPAAATGNVVVTVGGLASNSEPFALVTVTKIVDIPQVVPFGAQTSGGRMQITNLFVTVNFPPNTSSVALTFISPDTFTNPTDKSWSVTLSPGMAPDPTCILDPNAVKCHDFPIPSNLLGSCATCTDNITIVPRLSSFAGGPIEFEIKFALLSNYNVGATGTHRCASTQVNNPEQYQIISDTLMTGACVESYSKTIATCTGNNPVVLNPGDGGFVDPPPAPQTACFRERPALDLALVLDISGSMDSAIDGNFTANVANKKIAHLRNAVNDLVTVWGSNAVSDDQIGIALFDSDARWWSQAPVNFNSPNFQGISAVTPGIEGDISTCQGSNPATCTLIPGTSTSIGGGLFFAHKSFPDESNLSNFPNGPNRPVILLMSDGMQNTNPEVQPATTGQVQLYCDSSTPCPATVPSTCTLATSISDPGCALSALAHNPNPAPVQIYTVTFGITPGANEAVNQAIANNSHGFFINSETSGPLLRPFFLELLQNFLKFNSYDTVRMISERTPYSASVPISTTSRNIVFSLMWPKDLGVVRLTVTPPGGIQPIVQESASGLISMTQLLPLPAPFDPMGDWKILVEAPGLAGVPIALATSPTSGGSVPANTGGVPFDLHVMTDDGGVKSDLSVVPGDYKPGDKIRLRAKLTQFGRPILGLGSHPGDTIEAHLIKPGNSIGDVLSDSKASATASCPPSGPCDPQTPAEAKLANTLKNNPAALAHTSDTVQLFDDGKAEHGDDVAGDGIYSALYPADLVGHYNFLFAIESTDPNAVRFSRQQLRTAYVRDVPDGGKIKWQTSLQPCATATSKACNTLVITMTPRTKFGHRMGPGWANYFWFTTSGVTPFKANDNLNGTYTAQLNFAGNKPPKVVVHFENVVAIIGDSVPPGQLPQPLDNNNSQGKVPPPLSKLAAFVDLGAAFPHGTFSNTFSTGFSLNAGLERLISPHWSAEGIFGYHRFPANLGSTLNVYQFSANAKFYLMPPANKWLPFLNAGPGDYKFNPGPTNFGGNIGAGVLYEFRPRIGFQGAYNFHAVNTPGGTTQFSTLQLGVRFVL